MTDEISLVPPARLGALLTHERTMRGLTLDELSVETNLPFSVQELRRIEQGQLALSDDQVQRLMHAYRASNGPVLPERSELVIDLHHGALFAGQRTRILPENATLDDVLGRYLSLLYLLRGLEPGHELVLRGDDLEVLSDALQRNIAEIESRLFELMMPRAASPWFDRLRHRLAVPAAGVLVGLTTVGSLVLVQFPNGERASEAPVGAAAPAAATLVATSAGDAELAPPVVVVRGQVDASSVAYEPGAPISVGAAAESLIDHDFRQALSDWTIVFDGPREGYRGNTNTVNRTITVYVAADDSPESVAGALAHEIGHALDVMYLSDELRAEWQQLRGIEGPWWPSSGANDLSVGAGDFAEAVAVSIAGSSSDSHHGAFTETQLAFVADVLDAAR